MRKTGGFALVAPDDAPSALIQKHRGVVKNQSGKVAKTLRSDQGSIRPRTCAERLTSCRIRVERICRQIPEMPGNGGLGAANYLRRCRHRRNGDRMARRAA